MAEHSFSADVSLRLQLESGELSLAQVGPDFFILQEENSSLPEQEAVLVVKIDETVDKTPIRVLGALDGEGSRIGYKPLATVTH